MRYGMVWYGVAGPNRLASVSRICGTSPSKLNSCLRCGGWGLAPNQMESGLFRPSYCPGRGG